jgi:hypothetical protein
MTRYFGKVCDISGTLIMSCRSPPLPPRRSYHSYATLPIFNPCGLKKILRKGRNEAVVIAIRSRT